MGIAARRGLSHDLGGNLLLGTAKRRRPSRLFRIGVLAGISMRFVIQVDSLVDEIHGDRAVRRGVFKGFWRGNKLIGDQLTKRSSQLKF